MRLTRGSVTLEDQITLDRALDLAFVRGRSRSAPLSAARVRARVAWVRPAPVSAGWRGVTLLGRLGESSLALGLTAILFVGVAGGVTKTPAPADAGPAAAEARPRVTAPLEGARFLRWVRIGRSAPLNDSLDASTVAVPRAAEAPEPEPASVSEQQRRLR
jgi:hypothetical protein